MKTPKQILKDTCGHLEAYKMMADWELEQFEDAVKEGIDTHDPVLIMSKYERIAWSFAIAALLCFLLSSCEPAISHRTTVDALFVLEGLIVLVGWWYIVKISKTK